jgi:hypothetical protein
MLRNKSVSTLSGKPYVDELFCSVVSTEKQTTGQHRRLRVMESSKEHDSC